MPLAEECGSETVFRELSGNRLVDHVRRQVDADAGDAMRRGIGAGEDGGARGLAVRVLTAAGREAGALRRETVQVGCLADRVSINAEGVRSLLVSGDEKDVQRGCLVSYCA